MSHKRDFTTRMRTWKRTTERGLTPSHVIDAAVEAHIEQRISLAVASQQFNIPVRTLARVFEFDNLDEDHDDTPDQDHDVIPPKQTLCQQSTDQF
ncbi:hypothetical protein GE061_015298 [Apolygus lucorum]|uniref:Uncharacterized protein n=1 Tax=Apolygus lucorum TaxID=248454 RepID=A0A6A4JKB8_APOLU|nr:hypothetical protein GE061_015298 [Apolygus lucorum]